MTSTASTPDTPPERIDEALYNRVRAHLDAVGLNARIQTQIGLLLQGCKLANQQFLSSVLLLPRLGLPQQFMHAQALRELESVDLLARTVSWSLDPMVYAEAAQRLAPLLQAWTCLGLTGGLLSSPTNCYRGLALGHAALSQVRLLPVLPSGTDPLAPFVMAVARIEQENGRQLQTQIRLLQGLCQALALEEREAIIDEAQSLTRRVFASVLDWIAPDTITR